MPRNDNVYSQMGKNRTKYVLLFNANMKNIDQTNKFLSNIS